MSKTKETSLNKAWKEKAKARRKENRYLKQRIKELAKSRDNWKQRAQETFQRNEELIKEINALKKQITEKRNELKTGKKIYNYVYSALIIQILVLIKIKTSATYRAIEKIIVIFSLYFSLQRTPSHVTISLWVKKIGHYQLTRPKEIANDWIIILDESIQIGSKKLLLILGIKESEIDWARSLSYKDIIPLYFKLQNSCTGEDINEILVSLTKQLGVIKYAVCDDGVNLKKGLKLSEIKHVYDITHKIALVLKDIYQDDESYKFFCKKMSEMRNRLFLSDVAHIIPPNQKHKSRFLNISLISDWGMKALNYLSKRFKERKIAEQLEWVLPFKDFIQELHQINQVMITIQKILKEKGLSSETSQKCKFYLNQLTTQKGKICKEQLEDYFNQTIHLLPDTDKILATSDIIESVFGKYKNSFAHHPIAGMTNDILAIAAFNADLKQENIKQALENTTVNDIKLWTKQNVGDSLFKKRRKAFPPQKNQALADYNKEQKQQEKNFKMVA